MYNRINHGKHYILKHTFERNPDEEAMLWEAYHVKENSRLGCQILITEALTD